VVELRGAVSLAAVLAHAVPDRDLEVKARETPPVGAGR